MKLFSFNLRRYSLLSSAAVQVAELSTAFYCYFPSRFMIFATTEFIIWSSFALFYVIICFSSVVAVIICDIFIFFNNSVIL